MCPVRYNPARQRPAKYSQFLHKNLVVSGFFLTGNKYEQNIMIFTINIIFTKHLAQENQCNTLRQSRRGMNKNNNNYTVSRGGGGWGSII